MVAVSDTIHAAVITAVHAIFVLSIQIVLAKKQSVIINILY